MLVLCSRRKLPALFTAAAWHLSALSFRRQGHGGSIHPPGSAAAPAPSARAHGPCPRQLPPHQKPAPRPCCCRLPAGSGRDDDLLTSMCNSDPEMNAFVSLRAARSRGDSSRTGCHQQGELLIWVGTESATAAGRRGRCKMTLKQFGAKCCCGLGKEGTRPYRCHGLQGDSWGAPELRKCLQRVSSHLYPEKLLDISPSGVLPCSSNLSSLCFRAGNCFFPITRNLQRCLQVLGASEAFLRARIIAAVKAL